MSKNNETVATNQATTNETYTKTPTRVFSTKQLCVSAILIAIAYVISSFIPALSLPQGGSLTFCSMLFISIIGYLYGAKVGLLSALAYGLLQLIIKPSIYHPIQLLLDYPLAFTCLGISGFFTNKKHGLAIGYSIGVIGRYLCHVISGIVFFGEYAQGNVILYSLVYNLTYILPEMILSLILIPLLSPSIKRAKNKL